jgi:Polyketide cyclase / dehydrase and lipid transport
VTVLAYASLLRKRGFDVQGDVSIEILAAPELVYSVVSDLTRMGEFSPECRKVEWLSGGGPTPGARFVGHNRGGPIRWSREGRVVTAEPGKEFSFTTEWRGHDSTAWTYRMKPTAVGTSLTESYEALWAPWWMHAVDAMTFRSKQLTQHMTKTLYRLKELIESVPPAKGVTTGNG